VVTRLRLVRRHAESLAGDADVPWCAGPTLRAGLEALHELVARDSEVVQPDPRLLLPEIERRVHREVGVAQDLVGVDADVLREGPQFGGRLRRLPREVGRGPRGWNRALQDLAHQVDVWEGHVGVVAVELDVADVRPAIEKDPLDGGVVGPFRGVLAQEPEGVSEVGSRAED
jgi:hypothetical protein